MSAHPDPLALWPGEHGQHISLAVRLAEDARLQCSRAMGRCRPTSWPMGMADRGSVLPGLMVLAGPVLMWSPGRTPCGAKTYEKPLKSPPGDPAPNFCLNTRDPRVTTFSAVSWERKRCGRLVAGRSQRNEGKKMCHMGHGDKEPGYMPPAGYFTSAMRALLFGSYSRRSTTAVSPLWERVKSTCGDIQSSIISFFRPRLMLADCCTAAALLL